MSRLNLCGLAVAKKGGRAVEGAKVTANTVAGLSVVTVVGAGASVLSFGAAFFASNLSFLRAFFGGGVGTNGAGVGENSKAFEVKASSSSVCSCARGGGAPGRRARAKETRSSGAFEGVAPIVYKVGDCYRRSDSDFHAIGTL